jgi:hypothetical protein
MGDGLALYRAVDTYHMIFIAHYTPLTWEICNKRQLPELKDRNDLSSREEAQADTILEADELSREDVHEFSVLNRVQWLELQHHQTKFVELHNLYKPHETLTCHFRNAYSSLLWLF